MADMEINVSELLIQISNDVSAVKADMEHLKNEIAEIKEENQAGISKLKGRICELEHKVADLEKERDAQDARKWRNVTGYVLTAFGGAAVTFALAHLGDFFRSLGG